MSACLDVHPILYCVTLGGILLSMVAGMGLLIFLFAKAVGILERLEHLYRRARGRGDLGG